MRERRGGDGKRGGESASGSLEVSIWNWQCDSLHILLVNAAMRTAQPQGVGRQAPPNHGRGYKVHRRRHGCREK